MTSAIGFAPSFSVRVCTHVVNDQYPYFVHVEESEDRAKTKLSDTLSRLLVLGKLSSWGALCALFGYACPDSMQDPLIFGRLVGTLWEIVLSSLRIVISTHLDFHDSASAKGRNTICGTSLGAWVFVCS